MKAKELRERSVKQLQELLFEKRKRLEKLNLDLVLGKLKNYKEINQTKKDIARILTILKEKICQKENL